MKTRALACLLVAGAILWAVAPVALTAPAAHRAAAAPRALNWKAVLLSGDDGIQAFDNARKRMSRLLLQLGVAPDNIRELSANPAEQVDGVLPASIVNLAAVLDGFQIGAGDACLIHMTSHGTRQGFVVKNGPTLTPARLGAIVERACGTQPTVLLISACYSGVFVRPVMLGSTRVILTAAREDLTSFGCSAEDQYTYWDGCLIDSLPNADSWRSLQGAIEQCVSRKESRDRFNASLPQAYFGDQVADLKIPVAPASGLTPATSQCPVSEDETYGVSPANAIRIGLDAATGPARETKYLSALRGPAGQWVRFRRVGSTVAADQTILDLFEVTYDGIAQPLRVYLDEYHFEEPKAPKGLVCATPIGLKGIRPTTRRPAS